MSKTSLRPPDLSVKFLRAFMAVAELGTLTAAGKLLSRSDSAISLQIAALEREFGHALFERSGRGLQVTPLGQRLRVHAEEILGRIDAAREEFGRRKDALPVRVGVVQDLRRISLPIVLDALQEKSVSGGLSFHTGTGAELARSLGEGALDLVLIARRHAEPDSIITLPMIWLAAPAMQASLPHRLVAVSAPCPFLEAAQHALARAGLQWESRFASPNLEAVVEAAEHGTGILCRTPLVAGGCLKDVGEHFGLPALPAISYVLDIRRDAGDAAAFVAERLQVEIPRVISAMQE